MMNWFKTSIAELKEIVVKCALSLFVFLDVPSAKLEEIDIDALRNWLVNPNFSSDGKRLVIL